tara:strand:- start:276 stop:782 length:507 start_codon:yes stop_codon:yes gene_type:complete
MFKQQYNFIPRLELILPEIKKIKLYSVEEYNKKTNSNDTWPGYRSLPLKDTNVFLYEYICYLMFNKKFLDEGVYEIFMSIHLRLAEDNHRDWVHQDNTHLASLVYLSNSNYNSGTYFYDDKLNIVNDVKFIQNSCILYPGHYTHKGYGHHGESIENGRLTLNLFINKK